MQFERSEAPLTHHTEVDESAHLLLGAHLALVQARVSSIHASARS